MTMLIKLEEAAMLVFSVCLLIYFDVAWWCYVLLAIGPDISMLGYLAGNRAGAFTYNLFHHKGVAIACVMCGYFVDSNPVIIAGILLFGHSSMDRLAGYGLKLNKGFSYTHLGVIGKNKPVNEN